MRIKETFGAEAILRGVGRAFRDADHAVLAELPLGDGRRADLVADRPSRHDQPRRDQTLRTDFVADRESPGCLTSCDRFHFAVAARPGLASAAPF